MLRADWRTFGFVVSKLGPAAGKSVRRHKKAGKAPAKTLGAAFRASLKDLMKKLATCTPHFVRCIKPNMQKVPGNYDEENVKIQLSYTGVMETCEIRRQGYGVCFRCLFDTVCMCWYSAHLSLRHGYLSLCC